jgi:nucleoside-diphosphate kinase
MQEQTLIILKPDTVKRGLIGEIITRFEKKGVKILSCRMEKLTTALAAEHYAEHVGKSFYNDLITFMTSGPVLILAMEGLDVIDLARRMIGNMTLPGTIRGDYCQYISHNLIHGSDSPRSAQRELDLFFPKLDIRKSKAIDLFLWTEH